MKEKSYSHKIKSMNKLNAHRVNEGNQFIKSNESEDELKQDFFYINENSQEKMLYELVSLCKGRLQTTCRVKTMKGRRSK